jgi:phosphonate transport system ATP-binding protein
LNETPGKGSLDSVESTGSIGSIGFGLDDVTVSYGGDPALKHVNLSVEPGDSLAVIGASGAGKSTLFKLLTRGVGLTSGQVMLGGRDLFGLSWRELKEIRSSVGVVRQAYNLVPQLPVGVNAGLGEIGSLGGWRAVKLLLSGPDAGLASRVRDALERLGLTELARSRTSDISGGQQQRVAVARLLVQRPGLVLADEPFAAVDPQTTERVLETLVELNAAGSTLVVNLHDVEIARRFPRIVALRGGRIFYDGGPEGLTEERLAEIYSGDPYGSRSRGLEPEDAEPTGSSPRITGGQDGVASH